MIGKLAFYVTHSRNDLRANRQRSFFALLCIAAGVAAIVGLQTLGVLINDTLTGSLREANKGDIHIFSGGESHTPEAARRQGRADGVIESGGAFFPDYFGARGLAVIYDWFQAHYPGLADLTYQQTFSDLTTGGGVSIPARDTEKTFVSTYIVDAQKFPFYGARAALDGTPLRDLLRRPDDIVISQNLADDLNAQVGDTLRISGARADFTLRGIVPTDAEAGIDNLFAGLFGYYYLDLSAAPYFDREPATYDVFVRLEDPARLDEVAAAFYAAFPYVQVITTHDLKDRNAQASRLINGLVTVMGLISLLIGGIGIVNTMRVIVSRRTTEIAILKTLGLEPGEITLLFLTEAVMMGVIGSLGGVILGWVVAYGARSLAASFVAQPLDFRLAPLPALTGLGVGILVTAVFGFLPTLTAGQVRPATVLRPLDQTAAPGGRVLPALLGLLLALSALTQGLVGDLIGLGAYRAAAGSVGLVSGGMIGLALAPRSRRAALAAGLAIPGFALGYRIPALLVLLAAFLLLAALYAALWALIWAVGGGDLSDLPGWQPRRGRWARLPGQIGLAALLLLWPVWGIGRAIQRVGFVDLKVALRAMLATKGRGASTLLALVVGVFTLSLITMLVGAMTRQFETMLEREAGGNVFVLSTGRGPVLEQVESMLGGLAGVHSYAVVASYNARLVSAQDGATGQVESYEVLKQKATAHNARLEEAFTSAFDGLDAREVGSNLPDVPFYRGRQLTPQDAGQPVVVIAANQATLAAGLDVGDRLTFALPAPEGAGQNAPTVTLEIIGMVDRRYGTLQISGSASYAPADVFPAHLIPEQVTAVVDIDPAQIKTLRRAAAAIPGTFVLETRFLNRVVRRLVDQFTAFPILVAGLALFTGGVVIANSVALSTMERRREIAIMKAVGLQRERVIGMLLLETGLMGLIGGLVGVGIGMVLLVALLSGFFGGVITGVIPYGTAFFLMALCVGIALVAAFLSVWGTSGEKPVHALRYE